MAVKTIFIEKDFVLILEEYDLGQYVSSSPILKGTVQTNYVLNTVQGKFIFKYYNNREYESVLCEVEIINYLTSKNYPCPRIIQNKYGSYVTKFKNRSYAIYEYIDGRHSDKLNKFQWDQLIQNVAKLHSETHGYIPKHLESRMNYSADLCVALAEDKVSKLKTNDAKEKLSWLKNVTASLKLPKKLPKEICHGDLDPSNVLYKGNKLIALIDFDDANYTYSTFDLVGLIERFAWRYKNDKTLNFNKARQIMHIYSKYKLLQTNEKVHLFDVYKLSILIDSIWNYERGKARDFYEKRKIQYIDKIGRESFYKILFE